MNNNISDYPFIFFSNISVPPLIMFKRDNKVESQKVVKIIAKFKEITLMELIR